ATTDVTEIPKILLGDVNGDGKVNMKDVLLLRKVLAGTAELDLKYFRNSILDGEESLSLKDLLALRRLIAGD
ncbi:MAG: dockerin type I repeat-containing protein, partial [Ruminococcus sp.]|nr:dockerin type I repeat-containing protein [Ruminococcus sp.]